MEFGEIEGRKEGGEEGRIFGRAAGGLDTSTSLKAGSLTTTPTRTFMRPYTLKTLAHSHPRTHVHIYTHAHVHAIFVTYITTHINL